MSSRAEELRTGRHHANLSARAAGLRLQSKWWPRGRALGRSMTTANENGRRPRLIWPERASNESVNEFPPEMRPLGIGSR